MNESKKNQGLQNYGSDQTILDSNGTPVEDKLTWRFWKKRRYVVVLMAFFGFFNVYSMRVNLSIAIVAMTKEREVDYGNGTVVMERDFDWNTKQEGMVLSSFFYGYILTQLLGGFIAGRIGGNLIFGIGIGATAFFTLLTPLAAGVSVYLLIAVRVIEGIFEGVTFPCMHAVWTRWSPPFERSRMVGMAYAGNYVGTVFAMPVSGLLADRFGWESIFYVFGAIGIIWFIFWMIIVKEGPEKDPYISRGELDYIQHSLGKFDKTNRIKHPWKDIFTSKPVWAINMAHFSENWGFYTLLTQLPKFLTDTINFDLGKTGFISAIPYLTMGCLLGVSGYLADMFQIKGYLTTTQVRRYFNCGAFLAQTVFMILAAYLQNPALCILCITIAVGLGSFALSGYCVNHLDIAPLHASILMGISNTFATLPGMISPSLSGFIVQNKTVEEWRIVFFTTAGVYLVGCIVYWFWASGEVQPWAVKNNTKEDNAFENSGRNEKNNGLVNQNIELK